MNYTHSIISPIEWMGVVSHEDNNQGDVVRATYRFVDAVGNDFMFNVAAQHYYDEETRLSYQSDDAEPVFIIPTYALELQGETLNEINMLPLQLLGRYAIKQD